MRWEARIQALPQRSVISASLALDGKAAGFCEVLAGWRNDAACRAAWSALLRAVPFTACCWEMPPLTRDALGRAFECVFVESPLLAAVTPDPVPFSAHFAAAAGSDAVCFDNLGRDALLVSPLQRGVADAYAHLLAFARQAPADQVDGLWQHVAEALQSRLGEAPLWLSTAGLGVHWLHVRLDVRPKYYRYRPYAAADYRGCDK